MKQFYLFKNVLNSSGAAENHSAMEKSSYIKMTISERIYLTCYLKRQYISRLTSFSTEDLQRLEY